MQCISVMYPHKNMLTYVTFVAHLALDQKISNLIISKPQNLSDNLLIGNGRHNLEDDHLAVCFWEYFGAFSIFSFNF